ncbi:MAG: hydrolase [Phycisphaeraceae bacterium]
MSLPRFMIGRSALLVVDVQEKLVPAMAGGEELVESVGRLIDGANLLEVPVLATEQYPRGLGPTVPAIAARLAGAACVEEKLKFSACIEPVRAKLLEKRVHSVIVCGIEAHVCVLQTCLDLIEAGYVTAFVTDAITSRSAIDRETAVQRLIQAGAVPVTVESVLFELQHEAGSERFKALSRLVK